MAISDAFWLFLMKFISFSTLKSDYLWSFFIQHCHLMTLWFVLTCAKNKSTSYSAISHSKVAWYSNNIVNRNMAFFVLDNALGFLYIIKSLNMLIHIMPLPTRKLMAIWQQGLYSLSNKTFITTCRKISQPRNTGLQLFDGSEIWQASLQQCSQVQVKFII